MMKKFFLIFLLILTGCKHSYQNQYPALNPAQFFNGNLSSYGYFKNFKGQVISRFNMQATAHWNGDKGEMQEKFQFTDGTTNERHWKFTKIDETHFIGTAPDVIGEARGEVSGNSLHWIYKIRLTSGTKSHVVKFDDWLYLINETHMFSEVKASKFGLPVGQMIMFFEK